MSEIAIHDLSFGIEGKQILDGINLSLDQKRVGVVGRNGSGKSSFARIVAGLVAPTGGKIRVNGLDLAKDRRAALREVGILFQNPEHQIIFPTVGEEIAFGLEQQGHPKPDVERGVRDILTRFGLSHWQEVYVATLSQGQKHLVAMMSVMAMTPRLLILDEPFAGLDIPTKAQLKRYLGMYQGSLLHITHDPTDLEGYDTLIWIDEGRIRQAASHREVMPAYIAEMHKQGEVDDLADLAN